MSANPQTYLADLVEDLKLQWPENRIINIVCHGHSVPAGYFVTPVVDTFGAYPHQLHEGLKHRFPFAVINVIVTAIGGEDSSSGAERFERDVLCHRPDVITIDYGLNDRFIGLSAARESWERMIELASALSVKLILLTPTPDLREAQGSSLGGQNPLPLHAEQIRGLSETYGVGLVDSFGDFAKYAESSGSLSDLMSWHNHPNRKGHEIVAGELLRWFPVG